MSTITTPALVGRRDIIDNVKIAAVKAAIKTNTAALAQRTSGLENELLGSTAASMVSRPTAGSGSAC